MEDLKLLQTHHAYFQSFPLNPKRSFFTLQFTNPNFFFRKSTHGLLCQNNHIPLFEKIYMDLPLFAKYLAIYYFFETWFFETWFCVNLSYIKKFQIFFMVLKFQGKLDFHKIKFQKSNRLLNIFTNSEITKYFF